MSILTQFLVTYTVVITTNMANINVQIGSAN